MLIIRALCLWPFLSLFVLLLRCAPAHAQVAIGIQRRHQPHHCPVYDEPRGSELRISVDPGLLGVGADTGYYWVPGTWVLPPQAAVLWTPGYWGCHGGRYVFNDGLLGTTGRLLRRHGLRLRLYRRRL